MDKSTIF